jgi:hypothetical protein
LISERGFVIQTCLADNKFENLRGQLLQLNVEMNLCAPGEHVSKIYFSHGFETNEARHRRYDDHPNPDYNIENKRRRQKLKTWICDLENFEVNLEELVKTNIVRPGLVSILSSNQI